MQINVKLLDGGVLPKYATPGAAGFDLVAAEDVLIPMHQTRLVRTGLAFEIPDGYELQIRPRSGMSLKTPLRVANSPGTIDYDYRGEVKVILDNIGALDEDGFIRPSTFASGGAVLINKGDRIAQGVITPIVQAQLNVVSEISDTFRGTGGFGHTGTN
jgi:dUTP pyrophosphatase